LFTLFTSRLFHYRKNSLLDSQNGHGFSNMFNLHVPTDSFVLPLLPSHDYLSTLWMWRAWSKFTPRPPSNSFTWRNQLYYCLAKYTGWNSSRWLYCLIMLHPSHWVYSDYRQVRSIDLIYWFGSKFKVHTHLNFLKGLDNEMHRKERNSDLQININFGERSEQKLEVHSNTWNNLLSLGSWNLGILWNHKIYSKLFL